MPAVQAAREAARRSQCINHLKQFGTATHNFVSSKGKLPPSTIHQARASVFVMLMPFYEQQSLYDFLVPDSHETSMVTGTGADQVRHYNWWNSLTTDQQQSLGAVPIYKCPTRRTGMQLPTDFDPADDQRAIGPVSDYSIPTIMHIPSGGDPVFGYDWHTHYNSNDPHAINDFFGPFRPARLPSGVSNLTGVILRDDIGYWSDGTSNQLIFGEKHIPQGRMNVCRSDWYMRGDCSVLTEHTENQCSVMRLMHIDYRLARGPSDYIANSNDESALRGYGFGSYHSGVCNFLLGDSSVRSVSTTTSMPNVLCPLTDISDGVSVSLP